MGEVGIPDLAEEQIEDLSEIAEEAARKHISSKVAMSQVTSLDIVVETTGSKPVTVSIDVNLALSPQANPLDVKGLVNEAADKAFEAVEGFLRELSCRSTT